MHSEIEGSVNIYRNKDFLIFAPILGSSLVFDLQCWYPENLADEELGYLTSKSLDKSNEYIREMQEKVIFVESNYSDWVKSTKKNSAIKRIAQCL